MSTLPLTEAILLEIHQSLGCASYATVKQNKFVTGQASMEAHKVMGEEVLHTIFDALDMVPRARLDALDGLTEFANAYKTLELNTWTFAADERQILWMLLGYFYVPGLARRAAFWNLGDALDKGMPGGRFWYLPEPRDVDGEMTLYLPVAQVVDWLLDLLGVPLEEFANQRSQSLEDSDDKSSEALMRSLYNWRRSTTPELNSIREYFPDELQVKFEGAFSPDSTHSPAGQFDDAQRFVSRKKLTADKLRLEIPMTQPGRIEAVLEGCADEDEKEYFVRCLSDRYAPPSPHTIRQRLLFARMIQDGYTRLLKFLCPGVDRLCADARNNKLLQLFAIYKLIYNLTIDAWRNCSDQGEAAENVWFEEHLPQADKFGLFLSILPSQREASSLELARLLTRHFSEMQEGSELENHVGLDAETSITIIRRNDERVAALADELSAESDLVERMKSVSPWRALQGEHRYAVVRQVGHRPDLSSRAKEAATQRLRELSVTPALTVQTILFELNGYLNGERKQQPKDVRERVQALLDEASASEGYRLWKAAILQYKAKHLLACNDFEGAGELFREALEAGRERNYGPLRGEVARDCLAVSVANQKLIVNNHEKYYREMLAGGVIEGEEIPTFEDTARWAADYFWSTLYKPYPGLERLKPMAGEKIAESIRLLMTGDQQELLRWIKCNRKELNSHLPLVSGETALMCWIKLRTHFAKNSSLMRQMTHLVPQNEHDTVETLLGRLQQAIGVLAQQAPKQLNVPDFKRQTPLMLLSENGDTELVKLLLQAGADPDVQDWKGMTALHSAIKSGSDGCVDALLDHPCRLDKRTDDGQSPLHTAAWSGNLHATQRLLQLAPELAWQRNSQEMTPLEQVEVLVENPQALQRLTEVLMKNGKHPASSSKLDKVVEQLERAKLH